MKCVFCYEDVFPSLCLEYKQNLLMMQISFLKRLCSASRREHLLRMNTTKNGLYPHLPT
uniref:Uncharacterized protein n=1 Tax=Anguilla anguilla TaxID=7936 RepID=A0A0E9S0T9_ANGAN